MTDKLLAEIDRMIKHHEYQNEHGGHNDCSCHKDYRCAELQNYYKLKELIIAGRGDEDREYSDAELSTYRMFEGEKKE